MDIKNLDKLINEGKIDEAVDSVINEPKAPENKEVDEKSAGEIAKKVEEKQEADTEELKDEGIVVEEAPVENKEAEEVNPDEVTNEVKDKGADEEVKAEEVKEVVVENEEPTVEKAATEVKPEEVKNEVEKKAEAEEVAAEEVKEVEIKESEEPVENKEAEEVKVDLENKDIYCDVMEPSKGEDVKEVVVENSTNEDTLEVEPAVVDAKEEGNNDGVEQPIGEPETEDKKVDEVADEVDKLLDTTPTEEPKDNGEDVEITLAKITESMNSIFAALKEMDEVKPEEVKDEVEKKAEAEEVAAEEVKEVVVENEEPTIEKAATEVKADLENKDIYCDVMEPVKGEDVKEVVVEDTSLKESEGNADLENKDIYNKETEPVSVDDVVGIIIEACKRAKDKGRALKEDIVRETKNLLQEADIKIGDFCKKEYDVDAEINPECDKEECKEEKPEATPIKESLKYTSIKEACMLDENYFWEDSYQIETSDEKLNKLTEQVALLIARESNDNLYNEMLKEAVYVQRLQEAIINKYHSAAEEKALKIAGKKKTIN